ncbi:MAG: hypothetical protein VX899_08020 [Myxococcota bacterium]|nr:hypothetical protein [Myxococcota bacterium]
MSLLSDTQGRPERVWSLCRLLDALGGQARRDEVETWMMPASFRENEKSLVQVRQTIGAARSLGVVRDDGSEIALQVEVLPDSLPSFSDLAHGMLRDQPSDADIVMMRAYACVVLETERTDGTSWLAEQSDKQIADRIDEVLRTGEDIETRLFNPTKIAPWRAWMLALGLGFEGGPALPTFFPQPAERILRELPKLRSESGTTGEIPASTFMSLLAARMPYLDHGAVSEEISSKMGYRLRPGWVSRVVSEALLDLHDDGVLRLVSRADAPDALSLVGDATSPVKSFVGVVLLDGGAP